MKFSQTILEFSSDESIKAMINSSPPHLASKSVSLIPEDKILAIIPQNVKTTFSPKS